MKSRQRFEAVRRLGRGRSAGCDRHAHPGRPQRRSRERRRNGRGRGCRDHLRRLRSRHTLAASINNTLTYWGAGNRSHLLVDAQRTSGSLKLSVKPPRRPDYPFGLFVRQPLPRVARGFVSSKALVLERLELRHSTRLLAHEGHSFDPTQKLHWWTTLVAHLCSSEYGSQTTTTGANQPRCRTSLPLMKPLFLRRDMLSQSDGFTNSDCLAE